MNFLIFVGTTPRSMENLLKLSEDKKTLLGIQKATQHIKIPDYINTIKELAFKCNDSRSIYIPSSVTTIEKCAFCRCSSLQKISISKSNPNYISIKGVLYNKQQNTIIKFPSNKKISEFKIPNSVTTIGHGAFCGCKYLQSIYIPSTVTIIGNNSFSGCESLQNIEISNSVTTIGHGAFSGCKSLQHIDIPNSITFIGNNAFSRCSSLQSIKIPNSVTTIKGKTFFLCFSLQSIEIPNSVTTIEDDVFKTCFSLQSIDVSKENSSYASLNGVLYDKELKTIIKFPIKKNINEYKIPNSVLTIGNKAFNGCKYLQNIEIPNNVINIGDEAFIGSKVLQGIYLRITNIENVNISESAFNGIDTNNCILYIPPGTRWAYRHHPVFDKFKNIEIEKQEKH